MIQRAHRKLKALLSWLVALRLAVLHYAGEKSIPTTSKQEAAPTGLAKEILRVLQQGLAQGHTCLSRKEVWQHLHPQGVTEEEITAALQPLRESGWIDFTENTISLSQCARAEPFLAESLPHIGCSLSPIHPHLLTKWMQKQDVPLSDEQQAAIRLLSAAPVTILTGDPGTGKTPTIKVLTDFFRQVGYGVYLTAPTGRAAARLAEAAGNEAQTLHRFLRTRRPQDRTLRELFTGSKEVIVVDEASMLDLFLAERLVSICTPRIRLIFVGDAHQLPPVGAGQVLHDLLRGGVLPVVVLMTCFRQTEKSRIIAAAQSIKQGRVPELAVPGQEKSNCYFIDADGQAGIQQLVIKAVTSSLPARSSAKSVYDFSLKTIDGKPMKLDTLRGKVVLLVNVASKCGYTPQYTGLQATYAKYKDQGLVVLGVPANNFGGQEPGTEAEIKEFCTLNYKVTFPLTAKVSVKGTDIDPLFAFLTDKAIHPTTGGDLTWNFNKFLIGRDGKVLDRFASGDKPEGDKVTQAIEAALKAK
jgi:glutathione peroxidase